VLRDGQYERMPRDAQGLVRSGVFPGLWLDPAALLRGDLATVLAIVQQVWPVLNTMLLSRVSAHRPPRRRSCIGQPKYSSS